MLINMLKYRVYTMLMSFLASFLIEIVAGLKGEHICFREERLVFVFVCGLSVHKSNPKCYINEPEVVIKTISCYDNQQCY